MTELTDPSHEPQSALAGLPRYAVHAVGWAFAELAGAIACLVFGISEDVAWLRTIAGIASIAAVVTLGVTVVCLRQDAMLRSMEATVHRVEEVVRGLAAPPRSGATDRLDEIVARVEELSRDFAQSQVARLHRGPDRRPGGRPRSPAGSDYS